MYSGEYDACDVPDCKVWPARCLSAHNSKETGEIFRISPRKSARGIRPLYRDSKFSKFSQMFCLHFRATAIYDEKFPTQK
jgi:hypothetical protein